MLSFICDYRLPLLINPSRTAPVALLGIIIQELDFDLGNDRFVTILQKGQKAKKHLIDLRLLFLIFN